MNNKTHQGRADYFLKQARYELLQAMDIEIENAKEAKSQCNNADISYCCIRIGTLICLRAQIKDLIEKP